MSEDEFHERAPVIFRSSRGKQAVERRGKRARGCATHRTTMYNHPAEVQSGDHSFTALIRGGTRETKTGQPASLSGAALLDGVVLTGWRTRPCFQGTITVGRSPRTNLRHTASGRPGTALDGPASLAVDRRFSLAMAPSLT